MIVELKKCPFCGGDTAELSIYSTGRDKKHIVKTIYISLPAKGITEEEKYIIAKSIAENASEYLGAMVELREPYPEKGSNEFEILATRLRSLGEAEYAIFPEGWELIKESRIEYETAKEYNKKILIEHGNKLQEEL